MPLEWDKEELERALRNYDPAGYPVSVPVLGEGKIQEQLLGTTGAMYRVKLERPISFDAYAERIRAGAEPLSREDIEAMWEGRTLPFSDEFIESGPSRKDIEYMKVKNSGCMGPDETVVCTVAPWSMTSITKIKRGMLVEYSMYVSGDHVAGGTGGARVWAGRVVGIRNRTTVLLELFEPVTYYRTVPMPVVNEEIKPGFYSQSSWAFAYGLMEAMEMAGRGEEIPPGKWTDDKKEYLLDQPYPIENVKRFCEEHFPDEPHCFFHALTMFIVPIELGAGGTFHPLRQDRLDDYMASVQVNYEF